MSVGGCVCISLVGELHTPPGPSCAPPMGRLNNFICALRNSADLASIGVSRPLNPLVTKMKLHPLTSGNLGLVVASSQGSLRVESVAGPA